MTDEDCRAMVPYWNFPNSADAHAQALTAEVNRWLAGEAVSPIQEFAELFRIADPGSVLDVGCGCGLYRQVARRLKAACRYLGCDVSQAMIDKALELVPGGMFDRCDARHLDLGSFDLVVESCVMLHVLDWRRILSECCRSSKYWMMLHRTPWATDETICCSQDAYGHDFFVIRFARDDITHEMHSHGFMLAAEREIPNQESSSTLWQRPLK